MTCMGRHIPALPVLLAVVVGLLLAWTGGFLLSSRHAICTDGVTGGECSGRFASVDWHALGVLALILGGVTVVSAIAIAVRPRRESRH